MKINEREIKLILFVIILLVIGLPFLFYIQPTMNKKSELEIEVADLSNTKNQLEEWVSQSENYKAESEKILLENDVIMQKYPSDLPQEAGILFIDSTEKSIPIKLVQVAFGDDVSAQLVSNAEGEQIEAVENATGDVTQTEVIEDTTQTVSLSGGLKAIVATTQFTFSAEYQQFKDFLNHVAQYKERMVITELSAAYTPGVQTVDGSFTLVQYAVMDAGREPVEVNEPTLRQGTGNIFLQAGGSVGSDTEANQAPDFFMMLSQPNAEVEAKIIGRSRDASEESYLTDDANSEQEVTITFEGEEGGYVVHYAIGDEEYEGDELTLTKDEGSIMFEVISSPRVGDNDNVAARMEFINRTDIAVYVQVKNDDAENPRVDIRGMTGDVKIIS